MKRPLNHLTEGNECDEVDIAYSSLYEDSSDEYLTEQELQVIDSDENVEFEWEDVPLTIESTDKPNPNFPQNVNIVVSSSNFIRSGVKKKQKREKHHYQRLKYGLQLTEIPFFLRVLKNRSKLCLNERLNRRLKRSVPKVITKKFSKWKGETLENKENKLRTLLLGIVMWFRTNYKINSNGFRQNFARFHYLIQHSEESFHSKKDKLKYNLTLNNDKPYYGSRPVLECLTDDIRKMAQNKMANRDYLVLFFIIILNNLLKDNCNYTLRLSFALPVHDFDLYCNNAKFQIDNDIGIIPNKYDSDLLLPNFWIELIYENRDIYVIDPIVNIKENDIISKYKINEPVQIFKFNQSEKNMTQKIDYIASVDISTQMIIDVSPRYISNLCYRYFSEDEFCPFNDTKHRKSFKYYSFVIKCLNKEEGEYYFDNRILMKYLAMNNYQKPCSYSDIFRSRNFILPSQLKLQQYLKPDSRPCCTLTYNVNSKTTTEQVYWKKDVSILRSRQNWNILGYSILEREKPRKLKKYRSLKSQREGKYQEYAIKELFSFNQVFKTPKLPSHISISSGIQLKITDPTYYKNKHQNVEIYNLTNIPDGFKVILLKSNIPGLNIRHLIKAYNKSNNSNPKIKQLDVVTGFDFKGKPGYAMPQITHILVNDNDYQIIQHLINKELEVRQLEMWSEFVSRLKIYERVNATGFIQE